MGPSTRLEPDLPLLVQQIQATGHSAVTSANRIIHVIDDQRDLVAQMGLATSRDFHTLLVLLRLRQDNISALVSSHRPTVTRVRLADVDDQKIKIIAIGLVKPFEIAGFASKRSAGEVSENQDGRFVVGQLGQRDGYAF